ncbi:neutral zinc metallopeptidase [Lipingzhangella sp. LS1_29]|uniref:Neutral zinc metallopeptidase n=1 Tax=Lipingzhangella rawalii TaxID=2055835 RepID=A0ABU2H5Y4_9ACTN|nr:neutral zinc metallopeptidase [Lipingzhangella rawalii]MDS1270245.1 neutral zinc metallopeptidase [Lipingzhangella rawalii]
MRLSSRSALHAALAVVALLLATLVWTVVRAEPAPQPSETSQTDRADQAGQSTDSTETPADEPAFPRPQGQDLGAAEPGQQDQHSPGGAGPDAATPDADAADEDSNDDTRRPSGAEALLDNPLYGTEPLAPRPCPVPDLNVHDSTSMETFLNAVADCLDDAWSTQFARADLPFEPANRVFWSEPGTSPCRDYPSAAGAFYCRASSGIYIGTSDVVEKWLGETNGVVYASLLSHEYAHHVQSEAGLLEYYHDQRSEAPTTAERNEWTRRSELQADCLAGVFLGSIAVTYPLDEDDVQVLLEDARATADDTSAAGRGEQDELDEDERTHGTADNSEYWTHAGFTEQRPGACNTWTADEELVQ